MTSQEFPNTDPRIPKIIEKRLEGATWEEAAGSVGLSRRQVYNIRQTGDFTYIIEVLAPKVDLILDELLESETHSIKMEACKEVNRMRRHSSTKRIEKTEDITIKASIDITEKRKKADDLIKTLELTPDQYRVLEEKVEPETPDEDPTL